MATQIIRSGEQAAPTTLALLKNKGAKTFFHMVPGAKFIMPDGLEVSFVGGQFVTADESIIEELNKIADRPASMVYTRMDAKEALAAMAAASAADAEKSK